MEQKSRIMFTGMSCFSGISYDEKQHRDAAEAESRWGSESLPQFLNHLSPLQEFFGIQGFRELLSFFSSASREFLLSDHSPGKKSGNLLHFFRSSRLCYSLFSLFCLRKPYFYNSSVIFIHVRTRNTCPFPVHQCQTAFDIGNADMMAAVIDNRRVMFDRIQCFF